MNHKEITDALSAHFPPEQILWRVGATSGDKKKGLALAYLDSRDVMDRLDSVATPFGWSVRHEPADGGKVTAHISIKNPETGEWVSKSDGAGATDVEGDKGSYSDATKRAAVAWGIGRYLYNVKAQWVEIVPAGKSFRIDDKEFAKLAAYLRGMAKQAPSEKDGFTDFAKGYATEIKLCDTPDKLDVLVHRNAVQFSKLKTSFPAWHEKLTDLLDKQRASFIKP